MRVKNIELAYSLPKKLLQRAGVKGIRVSFSGNNLITLTKFKLYDPESAVNTNSTGGLGNPILKSFTAGIGLQF
jgi:hypothetical protein